jgi:hypothetical protein
MSNCTKLYKKALRVNKQYLPEQIALERSLNLYFVCKGIRPACLWWSEIFPDNTELTDDLLSQTGDHIKWTSGMCNISVYPMDFPLPPDDQPATLIYNPANIIAEQACNNPKFSKNMLSDSLLLGQVLGYPCAGDFDTRYAYRFIGFKLANSKPQLHLPIPVLEMVCLEKSPAVETLALAMAREAENELNVTVQLYLFDNEIGSGYHVNPSNGKLTPLD